MLLLSLSAILLAFYYDETRAATNLPSIPSIESILTRFKNYDQTSGNVAQHDSSNSASQSESYSFQLPSDLQSLKEQYIKANQSQLFQQWDQLTTDQQVKLLTQLKKLAPNPEHFLTEVEKAIELSSSMSTQSDSDQHFKPLPESSYVIQNTVSVDQRNNWENEGYKLISEGKVGLVVLAGGQGSRLGSSEPKGCFDVGLPSHRSLFQLQVERIVKLKQLTSEKTGSQEDVKLPLYVMTSSATHDATKLFFEEHGWFGLPSQDVIFFNQGMLPALSLDGKQFLLESPDRIVESPDGGGGLYKAWHDNGIIEDWLKRGIEHVHVRTISTL
ncbi:unnamed protein product [Ambrosiozyma monospora]|uniref:Unnamed protein product n=1 Tax=Ambrosiozyma monospora TaxID=43982 RepID=A0ACB5TKA0_AMBMO|nr:unnamed protein product [Ambrosiozyma monospora]